MNYIKEQEKWIKENNIKIGDKVIVTRKAESYENGWNDPWIGEMDEFIGKECEIIKYLYSISIEYKKFKYNFPYFVLKKASVFKLPDELFEIN